MSDLVGNPEDLFSDVAAQIMSFMVNVVFLLIFFFKLPDKNYVNTPILCTMKMTIQMKKDFFFAETGCWFTLELPHVGGFNEYPQSIFSVIRKWRSHIIRSRSFCTYNKYRPQF